jgi:hypothetical protein
MDEMEGDEIDMQGYGTALTWTQGPTKGKQTKAIWKAIQILEYKAMERPWMQNEELNIIANGMSHEIKQNVIGWWWDPE